MWHCERRTFTMPHVLLCLFRLVLEQIVEECIKVLVETCHEVTADDDRVVIGQIKLGDRFLVVVFQYEVIGLQNAHVVDDLVVALQFVAQDDRHRVIEILILVVDPLLDDATIDFLLFVVEGKQLAAVLRHAEMNVGEDARLFVGRKLLRDLSDGSLNLLDGLFRRFHINTLFY